MEVGAALSEVKEAEKEKEQSQKLVETFSPLLADKKDCDLLSQLKIKHVNKNYENIAGVEVPQFIDVHFSSPSYGLFDTPPWVENAIQYLQEFYSCKEKIVVLREKKKALQKELQDVSIRVNLFEKILIPRSKENIRKIKVFLSDQELAAIAQAKVAKSKMEKEKK